MKSIKELYKIGRGPSSSHTMGPETAARLFEQRNSVASNFKVVLYNSLSLTGRGHGTDEVLKKTFSKPVDIVFDPEHRADLHPNTIDFYAYSDEVSVDYWRVFSIGGGAIDIEGYACHETKDIYPHNTLEEIKDYCAINNITLYEYVFNFEDSDFHDYLTSIWNTMQDAISRGLSASGTLPGGLGTERKAKQLFKQRHIDESPETKQSRLVCAYAFAVAEENASGGVIVTAPTCGACGIVPAVLKYAKDKHGFSDEDILNALATAGLIGNIVKNNASISGAECGCQAEVGTACSMASAALAELYSLEIEQIEYASEVAMEHHLGLTCDPIGGLVQIPCIERNAVASMRAFNAVSLANFLTSTRQISFDTIVETMYQTGKDLNRDYRETSTGGLARTFRRSRFFRRKNTEIQ